MTIALLALLACRGPLPAGDATRPDIILVSIDSLRADHLGAWGYSRPTSPFLDRLAASGTRFADARSSSPWTLPSHWTMLTGLLPWHHGVIEDTLRLAEGVPTLTEALRDAGYATGGFTSAVYVGRTYGFERGFQRFDDHGITEADNLTHPVRVDAQVDAALTWARSTPIGAPMFLFLHVYDVHYPYTCPSPWNSRFDRAGTEAEARYRTYAWYAEHPLPAGRLAHLTAEQDECIAWVDHELERLHDAWTDSGRRAVFVVTADHGEELGERGSWGHAHTLHPEQLHVPLIVAGDGIPAAVRQERVGTPDLAATIAARTGLPAWRGDGVDLLGAVPERAFGGETARFDSARLSWEYGDWRLDWDLARGHTSLYNHAVDPDERVDVAAREPGRVAAMRASLEVAIDDGGWSLAPGARVNLVGPGAIWRSDTTDPTPTSELRAEETTVRFGLWPMDASLDVSGGPRLQGAADPNAQQATAPVRRSAPSRAHPINPPATLKAQLEALGYAQ